MRDVGLITRPIHLLIFANYVRENPHKKFSLYISPLNDINERKIIINFLPHLKASNVEIKSDGHGFNKEFLNVLLFYVKTFWIAKLTKIDTLIISGGAKGRILYKLFKFKQTVIIDEGSSSVWRFPNISEAGKPFSKTTHFTKLYSFFGVDDLKNKSPFSFYSIYTDFPRPVSSLMHNNLAYWRQVCAKFPITNKCLILGTAFHKINMSVDEINAQIQKVMDENKEQAFYYKPHKIGSKVKTLVDSLPFLETKLPIEYYFIQQQEFPKYIFCFGSTSKGLLSLIKPEIEVYDLMITNKVTSDEL